MALWERSPSPAENPDKSVASLDRTYGGTGLIGSTSPVHFTSCNTGNPHLWAFGTPDRPISVPNRSRRATKRFACRHNLCRCVGRRQEIPPNDRCRKADEEAPRTHLPKMFPVHGLTCVP